MWRNVLTAVSTAAVAAAAALWVVSAPTSPAGPSTTRPTARAQVAALETFGACADLTAWLADHVEPYVTPWGVDGAPGGGVPALAAGGTTGGDAGGIAVDEAAAAPSARGAATAAYSGTNVQEAGVDEPDVVKTDGQRLFVVRDGQLLAVDLTGDEPAVVGRLDLGGQEQGPEEADLLLSGDRLLAVWPWWADDTAAHDDVVAFAGGDAAASFRAPGTPRTRVALVDVSDELPRLLETAELDGSLAAGRLHGDRVRLVVRNQPSLATVFPADGTDAAQRRALAANRETVRRAAAVDWLPWVRFSPGGDPFAHTSERPLVRCEDVHHGGGFAGFGSLDVVTLPLQGSLTDLHTTSILTGADTVYASSERLFVTTYAWHRPVPWEERSVVTRGVAGPAVGAPAPDPEPFTTAIHAFDVTDPAGTSYLGSGEVPGHVLNQFSLSEHDGHLRVATTVGAPWEGGSESGVHVLRLRDGALVEVGSVGDLGRGERIYAVRYVGDTGYVVTFRQVDPLYTLDLSDPTAPRVLGELKIPGYSAYLHPVDEHRLLGVGQDATEEGRVLGTQIALYDVSDLTAPRQVAKTVLEQAGSDAEFDHHAFLYWPATGLTVLPISRWQEQPWTGAVAFEVDGTTLARVGALTHADAPDRPARDPWEAAERGRITRSLVVGDRLLTLSHEGLMASDLETLETRSWLPLR